MGRHIWVLGLLLLAVLATVGPRLSFGEEPSEEHKQVLILYSFENEIGLFADFDETLRVTLKSGQVGHIEFYTEFLDLVRFDSPRHEKYLEAYLREKYSSAKIDLIIPVSLPAINFTLRYGKRIFPRVPVLFCAVDRRWIVRRPLPANETGVVETTKINKTLAAALKLQPDTRRVIVVGGTLPYEKDWMKEIASDLQEYEGKLQFTYLTDLPMDTLLKKLANLPEHTVVLYMMLWRDGAGEYFLPREALLRIAQSSNAPVYSVFEKYLGTGMVGGDLIHFKAAGKTAGEMGVHLLEGESPADIPVLSEDNARYIFDWRQLRRWHISENTLPYGSEVLFREHSFWEVYKRQITGVFFLVILQMLFIAFLMVQRSRRKRAEEGRRRAEKDYREIFDHSLEGIFRTSPEGKILTANPALARMLGYGSTDEFVASITDSGNQLWQDPNQRLAFRGLLEEQLVVRGYECQFLRRDGKVIWVSLNSQRVSGPDGKTLYFEGFIEDITERKQATEALRKSEERYRNLVESANDWVWEIDAEARYTYAGPQCRDILGYEPEEIIGKTPFDLMPSEEAPRLAAKFGLITAQRVPFRGLENINLHKDGHVVVLESNGNPVTDGPLGFRGYRGMDRDITERKRAERNLLGQVVFDELLTGILSRFATCTASEIDAGVVSALQSIAEFIGVDHAYIINISSDRKSWRCTHEWCAPYVEPRIYQYKDIPFGTLPVIESRILNDEIVRINCLGDYPLDALQEHRHMAEEGHFSILNLPIQSGVGISGSIGLHSHARQVTWTDEQITQLRMVGNAIAGALERKQVSEMIAERIEAERQAAQEMEYARQVQARLLPQRLPPMNTLDYAGICLQARQVGGDYYDFLELRPGRLGLVLADVAGKGISAALLLASLQANLRSQYTTALYDPAHLLKSVNQWIYENSGESSYATLLFADYDDSSRRLRYVNCGHPPPLLLHADGQMERLAAGTTVLGLFEKWECTVVEVQLAPDDTLIIYSDGVSEARNAEKELFGEPRLAELVRAQGHLVVKCLIEAIVATAQEFSSGDQADDITLIVARCRS